MNGNDSMSVSRSAFMRKITAASDERRISGSVKRARAMKSDSSYRRMQTPSATRPHRPARWLAAACETGSICNCSTLLRYE
ncbi:hypothetical protein D3C86_1822940 [compost metagenome]